MKLKIMQDMKMMHNISNHNPKAALQVNVSDDAEVCAFYKEKQFRFFCNFIILFLLDDDQTPSLAFPEFLKLV